MSDAPLSGADALNCFLANAHAMESAAEEDIRDLAAGLKAHNNNKAAATLAQYAEYCGKQVRSIEEVAADKELPAVPPWQIPGSC